ncbi:MAG: POTRA domain-containing protein, partial [Fibrobacteria bacterium]
DCQGALKQGPAFKLGDIRIVSRPPFTAAQFGINAYPGEPATAANLKAIGDRIREFLLDNGQPFSTVSIDFTTRPDGPVADLFILIDGGEGYKFGGFKQAGSRTRPDVLDRLSLLGYGETFSEARLRLASERLSRTGYFEAVVPGALFRDSTRNLLYPSMALTDLKGNRLSGILGYDSEKKGSQGLNGYLDIHLINLRGTARDLDFTFDSKQTAQAVESREARLAYTEPWILTTRVGAHVEGKITLEDSVYTESSLGLTLFQDFDFHSRYLLTFSTQSNHDFLADTESDAEIAGLGFQYDARDHVPSTLNGLRFSLRVNGVHRDLGDTAYFLVQNISELALWKNAGRWVGHALFSGSGNWPLKGRSNRGDLYPVGGANTVRGFREREFLTNLFLYGNFELQFLLAPKSRAAIFATPAFINRLGGDVDWQRVVGYGLGLESGAKDWTFGVSYALNPDRAFGDGFVHLSVTNNF